MSRVMTDQAPQRDQTVFDGEQLTLGDQTITLRMTPFYTSGTMSVIVPVTWHGESHTAIVIGGTQIPPFNSLLTAYINSANHLGEIADSAHVDVALMTRPFIDRSVARMDSLRRARPDGRNPFIIGVEGVKRLAGVIGECGWVNRLHPREREPGQP
jgi:metallo-beta-lactamase class B